MVERRWRLPWPVSHRLAAAGPSRSRADFGARRLHAPAFGSDEIENKGGPPEVARPLALSGQRVIELANAAQRHHPDGPLSELAGDVFSPVRAQPPVEIPVDVHPGRSAPGGVGAPLRIE